MNSRILVKDSSTVSPPQEEQRQNPAFFALLVVLAWLPIPYGSNRPWAWALMEVVVFLVLAIWLIGYVRRPHPMPVAVRVAAVPLLLLSLWLTYLLIQALPMPDAILRFASPASYELYTYAFDSDAAVFGSLSVDRGATMELFLKALTYVVLFFLTLTLVTTRQRLRILAGLLVFVGLAEAVFGLYSQFTGLEFIPGKLRDGHFDIVSGTFVNRNHFAAHLEMVIPLGLGLLIGSMRPPRGEIGWRARLHSVSQSLLEEKGRLFVYVTVMFAALFFSASRAGNGALFTALLIVLFLALVFKGRHIPDLRIAPVMIGIIALAGVWLGYGALTDRLTSFSVIQAGERVTQWHLTVRMIADYLITGAGAGSYPHLFPLYKDGSLRPLIYDHAHSDYLELLAEQGLLGGLMLAAALLAILNKTITAYRRRHDQFMRGMLFASLSGVFAMLIHAIVDFNFYIPANAAYFYVLLAIGLVAATLPHTSYAASRSTGNY